MTNRLNYFSTNDATYAYRVNGDKEKDAVLLLHGFTGSMMTWQGLVKLLKKDFYVITVDLPGHGKTHCKKVKSMADYCDDLKDLLSHLNIEKTHLIGYSMGGRTALSFYQYYPDSVLSLSLESASAGLKSEEERLNRIKQDEKLAGRIKENFPAFVSFWESIPLFASHANLPNDLKKALKEERLMQTPKGLIDSLKGMGTGAQASWWDNLKDVHVPTLLIAGELDEKFMALNREMNELIGKSELQIIQDSGHTPHIEQADVFNELVYTYLKKFI